MADFKKNKMSIENALKEAFRYEEASDEQPIRKTPTDDKRQIVEEETYSSIYNSPDKERTIYDEPDNTGVIQEPVTPTVKKVERPQTTTERPQPTIKRQQDTTPNKENTISQKEIELILKVEHKLTDTDNENVKEYINKKGLVACIQEVVNDTYHPVSENYEIIMSLRNKSDISILCSLIDLNEKNKISGIEQELGIRNDGKYSTGEWLNYILTQIKELKPRLSDILQTI